MSSAERTAKSAPGSFLVAGAAVSGDVFFAHARATQKPAQQMSAHTPTMPPINAASIAGERFAIESRKDAGAGAVDVPCSAAWLYTTDADGRDAAKRNSVALA